MSTRSELDFYLLAGSASPGLVVLSGLVREQTWDVKDADGQSGGSTTHKGAKLIKFTATHKLGIDVDTGIDDADAWPAHERLINSTITGAKVTALDFYHPNAARLVPPLTSVSLSKMGIPEDDGLGGKTVVVEFLEYRPPTPKSSSASGSKSKAGAGAGGEFGPPPPDPNAAAKAELEALVAQADAP